MPGRETVLSKVTLTIPPFRRRHGALPRCPRRSRSWHRLESLPNLLLGYRGGEILRPGHFRAHMSERLFMQAQIPESAFQKQMTQGENFRFATLENIIHLRGNGTHIAPRSPIDMIKAWVTGGGSETEPRHLYGAVVIQ